MTDPFDNETVNLLKPSRSYYVTPYGYFPISCTIHGEVLKIDKVRIGYGLVLYPPNDKERYPYSNKWVSGGCLGGGPRYAVVMFCSKCREAEAESEIEVKQKIE
jgi:hypothetical protein